MSMIGKILGAISLGGAFTATPMYKKFLSGVAAVAALTVISGMMVGMLLVGLLYAAYKGFIYGGMEPQASLIVTAGIAAIATIILIAMTVHYLRSLFDVPKRLLQAESPMAAQVGGLADAFFDGLLTHEVRVKRSRRDT